MTRLYDASGRVVPIYDTSGLLIFGAREVDPVVPPEGPVRSVLTNLATGNRGYRVPSGGTDGAFAVTRHTAVVNTTEAVLYWRITPGFGGVDVGGVFRAAVTVGEVSRVVTFGGASSVRIDLPTSAGQVIESDPVTLNARAGDEVTITGWIDSDGGPLDTAPGDVTSLSATDPGAGIGAFTTSPTVSPSAGGWSLRPSMVLAPSDQPSWLAVGDSNLQGRGTFVEVAMVQRGDAFVKSAQGGMGIIPVGGTLWERMLAPYLPYATHVIDQTGGNAATSGLAAAQDYIPTWEAIRATGVEHLLKTTITVAANTTDNWASLEGQVPTDHGYGRWEISQWLKDGAPIIGGEVVPTGTVGAARCRVVRANGSIAPGSGEHPLDGVSDIRLEHPDDPLCWSPAAMAIMAAQNHGDGLHAPPEVHALSGQRLVRDLAILGY